MKNSIRILCLWGLLIPAAFSQDLESLRSQKPFVLSGSISLMANQYQAINTANRRQPFAWGVSASPTVSIYGISFPFQVYVSSQSRQIGTPFRRYGASPNYKWVRLHLGWRNLNFGQFTLGGQQILGGGFELTPGKLRVGFMYGTFQKGISQTDLQQAAERDSSFISQLRPQYARRGFGAKIGYGSSATFLEVNYLQAQDRQNYLADTLANRFNLSPAFNQVMGLNGRVGIGSFFVQAEAAVSHYVRDLRSDSLNLSDVFEPNPLLNVLKNARSSSQITTALNASLGYQSSLAGLTLGYRRIDPDFKSMGIFFIQSDIEQWTIAPNLNLFGGKLSLNGSLGIQWDNLGKTRLNNSNRTIGSLNLSINPTAAFGVDIQFANFGITQNQNTDHVFQQSVNQPRILDSLRIQQISNSLTLVPRFTWQSPTVVQSITFMGSYQANTDHNLYTETLVNATTLLGSLTYLYTYVPKRLGLTGGLNYVSNQFSGMKSVNYGANMGVNKPFLDNQMNATLNATYYQNFVDGTTNGYTVNLNAGANYRYQKRHTISLMAGWVSNHLANTNVGINVRNFSEINSNLRYSLTF